MNEFEKKDILSDENSVNNENTNIENADNNNDEINDNTDINSTDEKKSGFGKQLKDYVISFGLAIVIALTFRTFVFARADVEGHSMEATLHDKDVIFVEKVSVIMHNIKRGQIIIFDSNSADHEIYVKRVIGIAGDEIEIKDGKVFLNGKQLEENYLKPGTITMPGSLMFGSSKIVVQKGEVFVLGDNRENSRDSREIGPVKLQDIKGHTILRVYPFNEMKTF